MKKKIFPCVLASALLVFSLGNVSKANFETRFENMYNTSTNQMNIKYDPISEMNDITNWIGGVLNKVSATTLPKSYIPSYKDNLTVKNQFINGVDTLECWALAFTSGIESFNYAQNSSDKSDVYSARHVNLSCNNVFDGSTVNENRFNRNALTADGGNLYMATSYAVSGHGPVLESDMPSDTSLSKIKFSELETANGVQKHVEGYEDFPPIYKYYDTAGNITYYNSFDYNGSFSTIADLQNLYGKQLTESSVTSLRNRIKTQIKDNGGVTAYILQQGQDGFNINNKVMKYTGNGQLVHPNHAVLIVGWDDDYKADDWKNAGAYIALNSYGKNMFDGGYVYISYDDFYVEQTLVGITDVDDVDYDKVYEHDELGCNTDFSLASDYSTLSAVNIFSRDSSSPEILGEIGISSFTEQSVDVYYTESFDSNGKPSDFKRVATNKDAQIGFTTIELGTPITLTKSKFAICVTFKPKSSSEKATIAVELSGKVSGEDLLYNATANAGESYIVYTAGDASFDSSKTYQWQEMNVSVKNNGQSQTVYVNAGIKAYTYEEKNDDGKVSSSEYKIKNNMITRVPVNTTMNTFKSKITVDGSYTIVDKNGNEATSNLVRTGYKVKVGTDIYEISVVSDISGSGGDRYSRALDLAKMRSHIVAREGSILTGVNFEAADINGNGDVTLIDLLKLRDLSVQ